MTDNRQRTRVMGETRYDVAGLLAEPTSALARIAMSGAAVLASIPDPTLHRFKSFNAIR